MIVKMSMIIMRMIVLMSIMIRTLIMMIVLMSMIILKISSDVTLKAFLTSAAAGIGQSGHKVTRQGRLFKLSKLLIMITKIRMINIIMIPMSCNQGTRSQGKLSQLLLMITIIMIIKVIMILMSSNQGTRSRGKEGCLKLSQSSLGSTYYHQFLS